MCPLHVAPIKCVPIFLFSANERRGRGVVKAEFVQGRVLLILSPSAMHTSVFSFPLLGRAVVFSFMLFAMLLLNIHVRLLNYSSINIVQDSYREPGRTNLVRGVREESKCGKDSRENFDERAK